MADTPVDWPTFQLKAHTTFRISPRVARRTGKWDIGLIGYGLTGYGTWDVDRVAISRCCVSLFRQVDVSLHHVLVDGNSVMSQQRSNRSLVFKLNNISMA